MRCSCLADVDLRVEARNYIGETAKVASAHYGTRSQGQPTFANLAKPCPQLSFPVVIWSSDRLKFAAMETAYQDRDICVTGQIKALAGSARDCRE